MKLENPSPDQESHSASQEERRRSQRVTLRVGVRLLANVRGTESIVEAFTVNVNDHGALLICAQPLAIDDRFTLENKYTRSRVACRVTRKPKEASFGYQVAIEFEQASPKFWQIVFPPPDWKPTE
ncbi:MAG TPA: PilZ domain-containing protein [Candidatus Acidoferrales bacterium]|nr:PilZ domain-containing protein [Candidatus Acidoferrales bacterium]